MLGHLLVDRSLPPPGLGSECPRNGCISPRTQHPRTKVYPRQGAHVCPEQCHECTASSAPSLPVQVTSAEDVPTCTCTSHSVLAGRAGHEGHCNAQRGLRWWAPRQSRKLAQFKTPRAPGNGPGSRSQDTRTPKTLGSSCGHRRQASTIQPPTPPPSALSAQSHLPLPPLPLAQARPKSMRLTGHIRDHCCSDGTFALIAEPHGCQYDARSNAYKAVGRVRVGVRLASKRCPLPLTPRPPSLSKHLSGNSIR